LDQLQGQVDSVSKDKGDLNKIIASKEIEIKNLKTEIEKLVNDKTNGFSLKLIFQVLIDKLFGR
jgi:peptidoglycan hydrolase CwlO-like protein